MPLDGRRDQVRYFETNLGNLIADAYLWEADQSGLAPTIAFINSGTIRNNFLDFPTATPSSPADVDDTFVFTALPFDNYVVVVESVTVADLLLALENSVLFSAPGDSDFRNGRFLQISGFQFSWDTGAPTGDRIIDVILDDGTQLIDNGAVVSSLTLNIATNDFVATGGDGYSIFSGVYDSTGFISREALTRFIQGPLSGVIGAGDYGPGGEGRIQRDAQLVPIPEPTTMLLLGSGLAGLAAHARRRKK